MNVNFRRIALAALLSGIHLAAPAIQAAPAIDVQAEAGALWFSRNEVRIPGDTGTTFDLLDLTGTGPDALVRLLATWQINPRHALRLTLAPVETDGTGSLDRDTSFDDVLFLAGIPTEAEYRFNTYRLTYRWTFHESQCWRWSLGAVVLVRDAEISLSQADRNASKDNLGAVPLLHFSGEYRWNDRWSACAEVEGAGSPQGRAIDATLQLRQDFASGWQLAAGYRTIEGGADNDEVYNFAWLHSALLAAGYRF